MTEGSTDHFSAPAPPAPGDTTATDAPATETSAAPPPPSFHVPEGAKDGAPAASSSPGVALGTANRVTAVATCEATDFTADESAVTADGAADDTHASETPTAPLLFSRLGNLPFEVR